MRRSAVSVASVVAALIASAAGCADSPKAPSGSAKATAAAAKVASFECPAAVRSDATPSGGPPAGTLLQVVTTVAPITSIVANIAGDRASVTGIVPEGEDSHTFEPKPSAAAVLSRADLVFVNGLKLEDPTTDLATTNLRRGAEIVELGSQTITPDEYLYDFSFPADGGKPNPHLWTNPPMARCYASIAATRMAEADPANPA
ncbi:MAG: metal ABC transporter substrate-binding protein [Acidimicrobiales bacterium]